MSSFDHTIVVPTVGRPTLAPLLRLVSESDAPVIVVDDRRDQREPLGCPPHVRVVTTGGGKGPATARNVGWRIADTEWVVFLDDDVEPTAEWISDLRADLRCSDDTGGVPGNVEVPIGPVRPTDWQRNVMGLADAAWITADMAFRRTALQAVGGFDERFRRAYREDADLALRLQHNGWHLERGTRTVRHPVQSAPWWISVGRQRGNADDVLMRSKHGPSWRVRSQAGPGMFPRHVATVASLVTAVMARIAGFPGVAVSAAGVWVAQVGVFAWRRIAPGPRSLPETLTMIATSAAISPAAVFWHLVGRWRHRGPKRSVDAVLFDRDGTLVLDVPYNGDPGAVELVEGAREAIRRVREAGLRVGLITNQSGVGRGLIDAADVEAVNRRIQEMVGLFDAVAYCPHVPDDGCGCRKPSSGLVRAAARALDTSPSRCVVVGDILSDVEAGESAGARAILVPNRATDPSDVANARRVAADLSAAVTSILAWNGTV